MEAQVPPSQPVEFRKDFFFRRRHGKLDWRKLVRLCLPFFPPNSPSFFSCMECKLFCFFFFCVWHVTGWSRLGACCSASKACKRKATLVIQITPLKCFTFLVWQVDVATLQDNVEHITFADIGEEGE